MQQHQLNLLRHFYRDEKDIHGSQVDFNQYDFLTMRELDRLRAEIGSRCVLIRGNHGLLKETAVDAAFPDAPFSKVVMALFQSGFSKGVYQHGSIHLDHVMGPTGLARAWIAFKPAAYEYLLGRGFAHLRSYTKDGWDYYKWSDPESFNLLNELVRMNDG